MSTRTGAPPARHRTRQVDWEELEVTEPPGIIARVLQTNRHIGGLFWGGLVAYVRARRRDGTGRGLSFALARVLAWAARPFLDRALVEQPFPVQFRRRLELLGPTYIKLGQILSLREDILPRPVTDELKNLLSRLPAIPFPAFCQRIVDDLDRPIDEMFASIDEKPLGSASIGQTHRATTVHGDAVIIKVVKPGIPEILRRDAFLLGILGTTLQWFFPRYQPRRILREFTEYTAREVDLRREADNAETFAANFRDNPDIHFPEIYREFSGPNVLTMEFLDGLRPDSPEAQALPREDRMKVVDLGAMSIIQMIYRDGFFHADLHPGNLVILPGPRAGFIDLGMVGRLDDELRRTLLYYYYSLVMGDAESAARYLTAIASPGPGSDPHGFRREVAEISHRWARAANFETFSLGQLVLESVARGAQYGMFFPVEMVLMVKSLITFEGVGHVLVPDLDVAEISKVHVRRVFIAQFSPIRLFQDSLRQAPDLVDAVVKVPMLVTEGLRVLEKTTQRTGENPFAGLRGTLLAGFALVAGAIVLAFGGPWPLWGALWLVAALLAVHR